MERNHRRIDMDIFSFVFGAVVFFGLGVAVGILIMMYRYGRR